MSTAVAKLALEDGTVYAGTSFGASGEVDGEVCFNTSMTGYQEILTDPSYRGQIVTMTYPQIGNYGVNEEDLESGRPHMAGFIVRENCRRASNFRSEGSLEDFINAMISSYNGRNASFGPLYCVKTKSTVSPVSFALAAIRFAKPWVTP